MSSKHYMWETCITDYPTNFTYLNNHRAVRSNNSFALVVQMIKLKHYGERSFSYAAPVEWNKLDVDITYHSLI